MGREAGLFSQLGKATSNLKIQGAAIGLRSLSFYMNAEYAYGHDICRGGQPNLPRGGGQKSGRARARNFFLPPPEHFLPPPERGAKSAQGGAKIHLA